MNQLLQLLKQRPEVAAEISYSPGQEEYEIKLRCGRYFERVFFKSGTDDWTLEADIQKAMAKLLTAAKY